MYSVSEADLQTAGLLFDTFTAHHLALHLGNLPIPFFIEDERLYFYAPPSTSRYSATVTYSLVGNKAGVEMETAVYPSPHASLNHLNIQHPLEENHLYESRAASQISDPWFWQLVSHGQIATITFRYPHQPVEQMMLSLTFWGLTHSPDLSPDHDVTIRLNGNVVETAVWDNQTSHTTSLTIPAEWLHQGQNELILDNQQNPDGIIDSFYLDKMHISGFANPDTTLALTAQSAPVGVDWSLWQKRPFILNITNPQAPVRLQETSKPAQSLLIVPNTAVQTPILRQPLAWNDIETAVDFAIILANPAWETAVAPLVEARQSEGLSIQTTNTQAIYDKFGTGDPHPDAIQAYFSHLQANQPNRPIYALLVGDFSIDATGYANNPPPFMIPSPLIPVTFGGETVSDSRLGDIDGSGQSDIALGRWPVNSSKEVRWLVEKTLAAETAVFSPNNHAIIDQSEPGFTAVAQRLNLSTQAPVQTPRITTYIGHGSLQQWGQNNLQNNLPNSPILLQFTCLTGLFAHPTHPALAEQQLLSPNGPTHIIAATSLTLSAHQEPFAQALLNQLQPNTHKRIGNALLTAQQTLAQPGQQEIHDTFLLLGDPTSTIVQNQQ